MKNLTKFLLGLLFVSFFFFLSACQEKDSGQKGDYLGMDSLEIVNKIASLRENFTENRFEEANAPYFKEIAALAYHNKDYSTAAMNYMWALQAQPDMVDNKTLIHTIIEILDKHLRDKTVSDMFKLAFAQAYPDEPQSEMYNKSFSGADSLKELLQIFKSNMHRSNLGVDDPITRKIIDGSEIYATVLYDKPDAPEVIQEAALILQTQHAVNKALSFYDWVITKYPESEHATTALFMKAFTFENIVGDTALARRYYTQFIKRYPDHEFASQAQILLDNLGKEFKPQAQD